MITEIAVTPPWLPASASMSTSTDSGSRWLRSWTGIPARLVALGLDRLGRDGQRRAHEPDEREHDAERDPERDRLLRPHAERRERHDEARLARPRPADRDRE